MFVDGKWVGSENGAVTKVLDPSTGNVITEVPLATIEDTRFAIDTARMAFDDGRWSRLTPADRSNILLKVADLLERNAAVFARLESLNVGKSIKQSANYDIPYTVDNIRFFAGAARVVEGKAMGEYVADGTSAIRREPIGVVGVITPWNYPLMMAVWRIIPALATGNTVVIKPATLTPLSTLEFAKLLDEAGLPKGVFNVVTGSGRDVGEELARNPKVDMIAFTGSTEVGRRLSELASSTLKKLSLELGGKAPFIVFDDSDIEGAAEASVIGGLVNNGQDCGNSTRYYVHSSVLDKFQKLLIGKLSRVRIGDPLDESTDMGPVVSDTQRQRIEGYIEKGIQEGGKLLSGGARPKVKDHENGYYLEPTVISTENEDSCIVKEEIFGPVFTIVPFSNYKEVIQNSNNVIYGLAASVWTKDITKAMNAVRDLRFGTVWVNEHVAVPSEMPWAGYKQSGHGASLSAYSLEEYTYIKHVYFDLTGKSRKSWYYQIYGNKES